jgi:hypothetical protein
VLKIKYTLAGGPLNVEALGFSLSSLYINPALHINLAFEIHNDYGEENNDVTPISIMGHFSLSSECLSRRCTHQRIEFF